MGRRDTTRPGLERRDVLKLGTAATVGFLAQSGLTSTAQAARELPPMPHNARTFAAMPTRNLGKTAYRTGIFSLGGQSACELPDNEKVAVPLLERALDLGVNYIDTSARYGGPERWSERYIGQVMKKRRSEVLLATKTHDRTRDGSLKLLEKSLELLQTDHIDVWQIHNLSRPEQVDQIFAKGGAMEALQQARQQRIVRYVGVTGHADPAVLIEAIRRFPFDTLLLALNAADKHHLSFAHDLLPLAVEKEMGIIGMKIPARGRILSTWTPPPLGKQRRRPLAKRSGTLTMREAMRYVLSLPVSTVIVGCDSIAQLEENVQIARDFRPLSSSQLAALEKRAEPVAEQSLFFRRWTT